MKNNMDQPSPGDIDLSVLRTPIPTSVTGFMGVMKAFGDGTPEMRRVLEKECDLIYECKVCRNIFRDVVNLMTHKRLYCKTAFNSTRDFHFPDNGFIVRVEAPFLLSNQIINYQTLPIALESKHIVCNRTGEQDGDARSET